MKMVSIPDITLGKSVQKGRLDWVGMEGVETLIHLKTREGDFRLPCKIDLGVNLVKPDAKGIHMSRLYLLLDRYSDKLFSGEMVFRLLEEGLASQNPLSDEISGSWSWQHVRRQKSLKSSNGGYRHYPVSVNATISEEGFEIKFVFTVTYSSACPCSESLARQVFIENLEKEFKETSIDKERLLQWLVETTGIYAVPHSQRSTAEVEIVGDSDLSIETLDKAIDVVERALGTVVQTAVKREDEKEFAKINGERLMFCEDASRSIKNALDREKYPEFYVKVSHEESLHAHNAVAYASKERGSDDGF